MHTSSGSNYYVLDALGSVIALTNAAGTTDTALYTYDPYGSTLTSSGTLAIGRGNFYSQEFGPES